MGNKEEEKTISEMAKTFSSYMLGAVGAVGERVKTDITCAHAPRDKRGTSVRLAGGEKMNKPVTPMTDNEALVKRKSWRQVVS